jgi:cation diffusion facilitator family transporter
MHRHTIEHWQHTHRFHPDHIHGERFTHRVIALTLTMMVVEIGAGMAFGSMALLADGWHIGTHAVALGITALAYRFARRHADNPRFSFGTGKVGELGGFASAVVLAVVALIMAAESVQRFMSPLTIRFNQAIAVAVLGLIVNILSALMLQDRHPHSHGHGSAHHHDHNLKSVILSIVTHPPQPAEHYKELIGNFGEVAHVTVEVNRCEGESCIQPPVPGG